MLGEGVFTIPDASRLTRVPQQQLRRWFDGPAAIHQARRWGRDVNLTFADIITAMLIRMFREQGVRMRRIREVSSQAAADLATARPFALKRFMTDGKTILAWTKPRKRRGRQGLVDMVTGQVVAEPVLRPFLRNIDFGPEQAERWWPLGRRAGVVVDPRFAMGSPVTAKHRIPTRVLFGAHAAGEKPAKIAAWFEIPKAEVLAAIRFEEKLHTRAA